MTNKILKLIYFRFSLNFIGQETNWTRANLSPNMGLFFSDKIYLVEKGNSKLSKSMHAKAMTISMILEISTIIS